MLAISLTPNLSIVTGDSNILCGVLDAETTTSSKKVPSSSSKLTVPEESTFYDDDWNPTILAVTVTDPSESEVKE